MCVCICVCVCVHHRANAKDARNRARGGLRKKRGRALARAPRPPGTVVVLRVLRAARAGTPGPWKRREAAAPVQALPARSRRAKARARRRSEYLQIYLQIFRVGDGRGFQLRRVGVAGMRVTVGGDSRCSNFWRKAQRNVMASVTAVDEASGNFELGRHIRTKSAGRGHYLIFFQ